MSAPGSIAVTVPLPFLAPRVLPRESGPTPPPSAWSATVRIGTDVHEFVHETPRDEMRNMRQPAASDPGCRAFAQAGASPRDQAGRRKPASCGSYPATATAG